MKKLLVILILVGLGYGTYKYLEKVKETTAQKQDLLKPSEKALKEMDKETKP
jgi:hypothetical protein